MLIAISHRYRFIFVHVPKTGGSSIKDAICRAHGIDEPVSRPPDHELLPSFLRFEGSLRDQRYADYLKFGFVRNPWDRVVSSFTELLHNETKVPAREAIQRRLRVASLTFDAFVRRCVAPAARGTRFPGYHHWAPQSDLLADQQGITVDVVGRFESLAEDFTKIAQRLQIPSDVPHRNSWPHPHYSTFYTSETRLLVAEAYQRDLELWPYSFASK